MSASNDRQALPPALRRILDDVRRRIRAYVWIEGLSALVVLLGASFWAGLLVDWTFEPPASVRRFALVLLGIAAVVVAYRSLLRRVFVPIRDSSTALLLERRFPQLQEHLLTSVEVSRGSAATFHPELIAQTEHSAVQAIAGVQVGELFNRRPLIRALIIAAILILSVLLFAAFSRDVFGFWIQRIALSDEPWPRRVRLEVVGLLPDAQGRRVHKLAQDDDYELLVRASRRGYQLPDEVEIRFRLADGRRGRDTMIRVGEATSNQDFQLFRYDFKRVAGDLMFDVVGGDDRVRDLALEVVDRPQLFAIELECVYPSYVRRETRRLPVTGGMRIPEGTELVLHAASTKPLTAARIRTSQNESLDDMTFADTPRQELQWNYGVLGGDDVVLIDVIDADGVACREPYRISLAAVRDELPQVAVRLAGIGTAITPDAIVPLSGKITDDYGLGRAWFEFQVEGGPAATRPLQYQLNGELLLDEIDPFDTRETDVSTGERRLKLRPGERLKLTLNAADLFNLSDEPRAGSSQEFVLDVVTPAELMALLERRELAFRQRYEAIYEKVTDTRNLLSRVEFAEAASADAAQRALARRRLRLSGSLQNVVQSADEITGVAEAFSDLHDQLVNNRIDNPDLKSRLREQIAEPLRRIGENRMPKLAAQLKLVEDRVADAATGTPQLAKSVALADEILVEMRQVLDRMLELETYNEVVALLRGILEDQDAINRKTKEQQKERLRSLFE